MRSRISNHSRWTPLLGAVTLICLALPAVSQTVDFTPLMNAKDVNCLWDNGQRIIGGLDEGGLVIWERSSMDDHQRIVAGSELSGNRVSDMSWSGRYLWVATRDGGLTRISDPGGDMAFRQYSSNLGDINLSAVTGTIIADIERVFYAMEGAGIGRIVDGLPGNLYTSEQDGLIDNFVNALEFYDDQLFVGTPSGISIFSDNLFVSANTGLNNVHINDLTIAEDGNLLAAGRGGVYRWNPETTSWTHIGGTNGWVNRVTSGAVGTFALGTSGNVNVLSEYDGSSWNSITLPFTKTSAVVADHELVVGGRILSEGMASTVGHGYLGRYNGSGFTTWRLDASLVRNAHGICFDSEGTPWIGSHNADGFSGFKDGLWTSVYEVASAANDSSGLFNHNSNMLAMTHGIDGLIYVGQYTRGVVRHDPATGVSELMSPDNCGLEGGWVVSLATHPEGPIFMMHDWADEQKVEVLFDTQNWRDPASWLLVPTGEDGLGVGPAVWDIVVERNDVIWFAVEGTGLVRWDVNGDLMGPNDPLTWANTSDDRWDDPISIFPGITNNPTEVKGLALAPDGTIWAGGNGLVRYSYGEFSRTVSIHEDFGEKTSTFTEGLVNGNVSDITVDASGDIWVATRAGINRGMTADGETTFEAWFDLGNYLSTSSYGTLYSPDKISPLPGGEYRKIKARADGQAILLSSDRGAVLMEPRSGGSNTGQNMLSSAYLYPNPFKPGQGEGQLKVGGFDADAVNGTAASIQIYNAEGQLVFDSDFVSSDQGFWDGRNIALERAPITTGMYVVKITHDGQTTIKPLAVVR